VRRRKNNIKMDVKEIKSEELDWIYLARERGREQTL
jgi:hypothetical protein